MEEAKIKKSSTLITAGGPWSNHLAATAAAGKLLGFKTVGIIRGEEPRQQSSTLLFCSEQGMKFIFIPRKDFDTLPDQLDELLLGYLDAYFIPLGGENHLGIQGCKEIMDEVIWKPDYITVAVGTGTTMRGIGESIQGTELIGFSALKDSSQHSPPFIQWLEDHPEISLLHDYHFGGFARSTQVLEDFIVDFYLQNKIILDPVYTGKMLFGIFDRMKKNMFRESSTILAIHTGGLQGINGFPDLHKRLFTS
jgi:1-aminocyclopropane-1-carboxylate deaminase